MRLILEENLRPQQHFRHISTSLPSSHQLDSRSYGSSSTTTRPRLVVVTGGAQGIGRALTLAFAEQGDMVVALADASSGLRANVALPSII